MRGHLHVDQFTGSPRELDGAQLHFAGMDASLLTGGQGFGVTASIATPPNANGIVVGAGAQQHYGVLGLVVLAVIVLFVLDKVGFRFAVTAGKR